MGKESFEQLEARQQALRSTLETNALAGSELESSVLESPGRETRRPKTTRPKADGPKNNSPECKAQQLSILPETPQEPADGQDR
jgi:hypothetical protein